MESLFRRIAGGQGMRRTLQLCLSTGIMGGILWYPTIQPWVLPICFVPIFLEWMENPSPWRVLWTSWLTCFVMTMVGGPWVAYTARMYFSLSWAQAILSMVVYSIFAYLFFPLGALTWALLNRKLKLSFPRSFVLLVPILVLSELIFPMLIPTNYGYPWMWSGLPLVQLVDWVGISGLSVLTYLLNVLALVVWLKARRGQWIIAARHFAGGAVAFLVLCGVGFWHGKSWDATDREVRVSLIQPNHQDPERTRLWIGPGTQYLNYFLEHLRQMSLELAASDGKGELLMWPERTMPTRIDDDSPHALKIREVVREIGLPLLMGGTSSNSENQVFNTIGIYDPNGNLASTYRKSALMPFGEYIPGASLFPFLHKLKGNESTPGKDPGVQVIGGIRYGLTICYEALLPWLVAGLTKDGAQILINVSNDYWFGESTAPYQTLFMYMARSLEARRPLIRLGNVGISAVVTANGKILLNTPLFKEWKGSITVPYRESPALTIYSQFGWIWPWLMGGLVVLLGCLWRERKGSSR